MNTNDLPTNPIDGIATPAKKKEQEAPPAVSQTVAQGKTASPSMMAWLLLGVVETVYVVFGLYMMSTFPRQDGSGMQLKAIGALVLLGGAFLLFLLALLGIVRIATAKVHPRLKLGSLGRVVATVLPAFIVCGLAIAFINKEPVFALEMLAPADAEQLIAPVAVTFGMPRAIAVFTQLNLTPLKYQWDFTGDGMFDQETFDPEATFIANRSGVYTIAATITMTDGSVKRAMMRLLIARESFGVEPSNPVIDEPVEFSVEHLVPRAAQNTPTLQQAKWDFDSDGIIDLETASMTATYTYRKLGLVSASVTMIFSNQTQATLQRRMEVVKPPEQPFTITLEAEPSTLLGPPPFGAVFTLKTKEPIANAAWEFGDKKTGEGLRIAHVFSAVGTYTVNAIVRSQSGAIAKLSKIVRVTNPLSIPDLTFQGKPEVNGFTIQGEVPLTVDITPITSQPLISFSWDAQNASDVIATDKSFHAVYRDVGRYFLDLIAVDPDQNVFRKRIIINAQSPKSVVKFSMDPATPTAPAVVTFDASDTFVPSGEEITGFVWEFGDANSTNDSRFSGSRVTHAYEIPGSYTVNLTVRTTSNAKYSASQTLIVKAPVIDACFMPSRTEGKAPLGVFFDDTCSSGAFVSRLWDFGDGTQSDLQSPTHVFEGPGVFIVKFIATTKDGRTSQKSATISVSAQE